MQRKAKPMLSSSRGAMSRRPVRSAMSYSGAEPPSPTASTLLCSPTGMAPWASKCHATCGGLMSLWTRPAPRALHCCTDKPRRCNRVFACSQHGIQAFAPTCNHQIPHLRVPDHSGRDSRAKFACPSRALQLRLKSALAATLYSAVPYSSP